MSTALEKPLPPIEPAAAGWAERRCTNLFDVMPEAVVAAESLAAMPEPAEAMPFSEPALPELSMPETMVKATFAESARVEPAMTETMEKRPPSKSAMMPATEFETAPDIDDGMRWADGAKIGNGSGHCGRRARNQYAPEH